MAKVITFDGHDGVGKTSLISSTLERLTSSGYNSRGLRVVNNGHTSVNGQDMKTNIEIYLNAWKDTEDIIKNLHPNYEFLLVDRSHFSTYVLAQVFGIEITQTKYERFLKPDLAIRVTLDEDERVRRLLSKKDRSPHDERTVDKDLILRANRIYDTLRLTELNNSGSLDQTSEKLYMLLMSLKGQ